MSTFRKLMSFFHPKERIRLVFFILLSCIGTGLDAFGIGLILPLIMTLKNPDVILTNKTLNWFYTTLHMDSKAEFILWSASVLLAFFIFKNSYLGLLAYFENKFITRKQASLSTHLFKQHMYAPYSFHLQQNTSEAQNLTINQAFIACAKVVLPCFILLSEFLVLTLILAMLLMVEPKTTLLVITTIGCIAFAFLRGLQKKIVSLGKAQVEQTGQMIKWLTQGLSGIKDIKVFGRENFFVEGFTGKVDSYCRNTLYFQTVNKVPRLLIETLAIATLFIIILAGFIQGQSFDRMMSTLTLFAICSFRLMPSISSITGNFNLLRYHFPSVIAVYNELETFKNMVHLQESDPSDFASRPKITFNESIILKDVCYQYPTAEKPALNSISLTILKGHATAFVGQSGAGKSTLIDLILGLIIPTSGQILVDGQSVHDNLSQWRKIIGYVPQSMYFVDDTFRRNIAFGLDDSEIDETRLAEAIEAAQLQNVLDRLPQGLDTLVGERAVRLSGGEKQRLGIARALYYNPQILVMDEATSALDYEIEREISKAIERLKGKMTIILIAHRLSAVKVCDDIYSIVSGKLDGKMDFAELSRVVGQY